MKITNINYDIKNKKAILSGQMILKSGKTYDLYFEVAKDWQEFIARDASPFLAAALPLAMYKKEKLEIEGSLSKSVMENTPKIMKILENWNRGFTPVSIMPNDLKVDSKKSKIVGCFFSGGADSFYTYEKNKNKIDNLIFVHGFDINSQDFNLYKKIEKNILKIAAKEKKELIRVRTNIREIYDEYFDWDLSHGLAIASVALFLRNGLKEIYLSCGQPSKDEEHHYLSPELDNLWRSENMKLNHYGCDAGKADKLKFLSNYRLAMENLRVCWVNAKGEYNCCECEKCFRNMLGLYVSGSLEKCKTFNKKINTNKLKNIRVGEYNLKYFRAILEVLETQNDRSEIRFALEDCIMNNTNPKLRVRLTRNFRDSIRYLDQKYNRNRLYWFLSSKGMLK